MTTTPTTKSKKLRIATLIGSVTLSLLAGAVIGRHVHASPNAVHGGNVHQHEPILTVIRKPAQMSVLLGTMLADVDSLVTLSAAQKAQLEPALQQSVTELAALQPAYEQAQRQLLSLLLQDPLDRAAIEALRLQQMQLGERASQQITQMLVHIASSLTPEQRQQFPEQRQHFKAKAEASSTAHGHD